MGLLPVKDYNVRAIDTALVVMPERYEQPMRENYRYVISLYGADWGLAVDEVMNSVRLDPDQVRWRGQRSKRPWLAGTVVDQMCALLDIGQLAWMFHNQDRKRRQPMH
jgi:purine-binding chemotaxis protein CheW